MFITIEKGFRPYIDDAVVRLKYLFPDIDISARDDGVEIEQLGPIGEFEKQLHYELYRQKVFTTSLPMREMLLRELTRP